MCTRTSPQVPESTASLPANLTWGKWRLRGQVTSPEPPSSLPAQLGWNQACDSLPRPPGWVSAGAKWAGSPWEAQAPCYFTKRGAADPAGLCVISEGLPNTNSRVLKFSQWSLNVKERKLGLYSPFNYIPPTLSPLVPLPSRTSHLGHFRPICATWGHPGLSQVSPAHSTHSQGQRACRAGGAELTLETERRNK